MIILSRILTYNTPETSARCGLLETLTLVIRVGIDQALRTDARTTNATHWTDTWPDTWIDTLDRHLAAAHGGIEAVRAADSEVGRARPDYDSSSARADEMS
eukprot:scaffold268816_cov49-Prasinocladus_malaysianus.AAC.1